MPLPKPKAGEERGKFISRCTSFAVGDGMPQKQAVAACNTTWRKAKGTSEPKESNDSLMFEYFVPIESSANLDGDFTINGVAINETTTSNGHKFIGEELRSSANTLIGVPLLKDHNNSVDSIVGIVKAAHFNEDSRNIPFRAIVKDEKVKKLIKDGLLNTVSVGAHVNPVDIEQTDNGDIIPHNITFKELSLVAVPADPGATFTVALNNAYKLHSKNENSNSDERGNETMTEKEIKDESIESEAPEEKEEVKPEEEKEEAKEEPVVTEEKVKAWVTEAMLAVKESDVDEKPAEEPEEEEEEEEESEEVEERDYNIISGHNSFSMERKSYVYN